MRTNPPCYIFKDFIEEINILNLKYYIGEVFKNHYFAQFLESFENCCLKDYAFRLKDPLLHFKSFIKYI